MSGKRFTKDLSVANISFSFRINAKQKNKQIHVGGKQFAKVSRDASLHFLFVQPLVKFLNSYKTDKLDTRKVVNVR